MAEIAHQAHEFWRPPLAASEALVNPDRSATCPCGTEFIVSSLYCHACGASRPDFGVRSARKLEIPGIAELTRLGARLGLTPLCLIPFLLGVFCLVAAVAVSLFFSARTVLDWQAIQLWRIEWLLASVAAFVAGAVLKK